MPLELAEPLLTVSEVARQLRLTPASVYRHIQAGSLHAVRLGESGPLRVPLDALEEYLRPARREEVAGVEALATSGSLAPERRRAAHTSFPRGRRRGLPSNETDVSE
jgi:excisionase family DNA binding protein